MSKAPRVTVIGSFMMDLIVQAPRRPRPGETLIGDGFSMHLGGKGMNQAVAAARAGAETAMVGVLGTDDFGERFLRALEDEGIEASCVRRHETLGTGIGSPLVEPDGDNSIVVVPRANQAFDERDVERARPLLEGTDIVLVQFELPLAPTALATRVVRDAGGRVVVNAAPALPAPDGLVFDYLVVNLPEAEQLGGTPGQAPPEIATELRRKWDAAGVVVTLGADGLVVDDGGGTIDLPAERVAAVDTVGAGDAFCGYLAARLADGHSLVEAADEARKAGALAVTRSGGVDSIPRRDEVIGMVGEAGPLRHGHGP